MLKLRSLSGPPGTTTWIAGSRSSESTVIRITFGIAHAEGLSVSIRNKCHPYYEKHVQI